MLVLDECKSHIPFLSILWFQPKKNVRVHYNKLEKMSNERNILLSFVLVIFLFPYCCIVIFHAHTHEHTYSYIDITIINSIQIRCRWAQQAIRFGSFYSGGVKKLITFFSFPSSPFKHSCSACSSPFHCLHMFFVIFRTIHFFPSIIWSFLLRII